MSACGYMNRVCEDNEGTQAGETSYDFEEIPKISLFVASSVRGEGPTQHSVRLVPKAFSLEDER